MRPIPNHIEESAPLPIGERVGSRREAVIRSSGYVVFGMPRSRTAWLSNFLSYGDWHCGHDELRYARSMGDVEAWLGQPCTGTIETAGAPFWRLLDCKIAIVRRPVADVVNSLMAISGCAFDRAALTVAMTKLDRKLDQIEARTGCLSVQFDDLADEATCARLFEYCLPYAHDHDHWASLAPVNIQINMPRLIKYCTAYQPAMHKLESVAKHKSLTALALQKPADVGGMTFQTESFDTWLTDAARVLAEHHFQIGEAPENWRNKNIPLLRAMDQMGAMQITTARLNGRMFGYLMTLLTPSLATEGMLCAVNTAFFADPDCPGLGVRLQREALASFKAMGVGEVLWETNTVGSGNRIGALYRRLGAEEKGAVYRLKLAEAA
jgi:hypothetical protein